MSTGKENNTSTVVKDIVFEITRIAKEKAVRPAALEKAVFLAETTKFTEWDLRKVGGYSAIINAYFMQDNDVKSIQEHKNHVTYVKGLERQVGNIAAFRDKILRDVANLASATHTYIKVLDPKETRNYLKDLHKDPVKGGGDRRSVVTIWSDHHFGTYINKEEVGGKNEFNWEIGARRLGMLCEETATFKIEKRQLHDELVILKIGDNIGGVTHNPEGRNYDLMIHQVCGAIKYYIQALTWLSNFYPKIRVFCQPGNHGRMMHKVDKGRQFAQKYDSFENIIFFGLSIAFKNNPRVQIEISRAPFCDINIQGHRIYATHGDTVFTTGEVSKNISMGRLETKINAINTVEEKIGKRPYELFCTGHVHHPVITQTGTGIGVIVNGCLIGADTFSTGIGIAGSNPSQTIWESTRGHVVGDVRLNQLSIADNQDRFMKIIDPYRLEITA